MAAPTPPLNGDMPDDTPIISQRILAQYVRDLSFESKIAENAMLGDNQQVISAEVNVETHKLDEEKRYEVITKLALTNRLKSTEDPLFVLEIEYVGSFEIDGLTGEQLEAYLSTECARVTFPFLRRIVANITQDGGFAPLNLDTINFTTLYRKNRNERATTEQLSEDST